MVRRGNCCWSLSGALLLAATASAQEPRRGTSVRDLPRPGYETGRWQVGNTTLYPVFEASGAYDSNLFATSTDPDSAVQFRLAPRIEAISEGQRLRLVSDIYADARLHSRFTSEDRLTFGLGTAARYAGSSATTLSGGARYDRGAERRSDPETGAGLRRPALFDSIAADAGVQHRAGRFAIAVSGSAQWVNYLGGREPDPDLRALLEDRDLATYRVPVRFTYVASPRLGIYVEPYFNRRDFRRATDRTGVDRDATTLGVLGGVTLDIADRWQGNMGAGVFRANPDDPSLDAFSGLAMNGSLRWSPTPRTGITFSAFEGDVATVRSGATGRIDTRLGIRAEQEVRHNLLAFAGVGYRKTRYRGGSATRLTSFVADAELEFLVTRTLSVFGSIEHENRTASDPLDRFKRTAVGIGVRLRT